MLSPEDANGPSGQIIRDGAMASVGADPNAALADPARAFVLESIAQLIAAGFAEWKKLGNGDVWLCLGTGEVFLLSESAITRL